MSWRARLESVRKGPDRSLPEPTKPHLAVLAVGEMAVSVLDDRSEGDAMRSHLATLAADEGLPTSLVDGLEDPDLTACAGLTDATLRAYLWALDRGHRMDAGQVPPEWGTPVVRTCEGCGPVLLWADCPPVVKSCPWCFPRQAGKAIPRPTPREVGGDE